MTQTNGSNNNSDAHTSGTNDLYETLGVDRKATTDDISKAYKRAALKHHPDKHAGKTDEEKAEQAALFNKVSAAYEVLSDPKKRDLYDLYGDAGISAASGSGAADDAAAQAMFEAMFVQEAMKEAKKRRVPGGALFVDLERKAFFQRKFEADQFEEMREEMMEGLDPEPEHAEEMATTAGGAAGRYEMSARLPVGCWEIRLVEVDEEASSVRVTFGAGDRAGEPKDEEWTAQKASLRMERTFLLPTDAAAEAVEVTLDDGEGAGRGRVRVVCPTKGAAALAAGEDPMMVQVEPAIEAVAEPEEELSATARVEMPPVQRQDAHSCPRAMAAVAAAAPGDGDGAGQERPAAKAAPGGTTAARKKARKQQKGRSGAGGELGGMKRGFLNGSSTSSTSPPVEEKARAKSPTSIVDEAIRANVAGLMGASM